MKQIDLFFFKLISYGYLLPVNLETHLKENKCT